MKKTWQEKLKNKPSFPKALRLENGFSCRSAVREIRLAWRLSVYTRTLSYLYER
jgi:hypothetical protein